MEGTQAYIANLNDLTQFAEQGTVSKTLVDNDSTKVVLFAMAKGQSLSEHTAGTPAIIHVLSGSATIHLEKEVHSSPPGTLIYMPAKMNHAVNADENLVFLLTLIRGKG